MEITTSLKDKIIIALDFASLIDVKTFLTKFDLNDKDQSPSFVKVGLELFYAEGERVIDFLKEKNLKIFLDLKLHDIPTTVYKSLKALAKYSPELINIHALGGIEMMVKAKQALDEKHNKTKLIAVTHLTSLDQKALKEELNINISLEDAVLSLAKNAFQAKLDGIVCSALEAKIIKQNIAQDFITVCPGIRLKSEVSFENINDQKRILSPDEAINNGADYLVIGRAITQAENPRTVFESIVRLNRQ